RLPGAGTASSHRHDRRALGEAELRRLLEAAADSPLTVRGLAGRDRWALYLTAMSTGFRAGELSTLTPRLFPPDPTPPPLPRPPASSAGPPPRPSSPWPRTPARTTGAPSSPCPKTWPRPSPATWPSGPPTSLSGRERGWRSPSPSSARTWRPPASPTPSRGRT